MSFLNKGQPRALGTTAGLTLKFQELEFDAFSQKMQAPAH